MSTPVSEPYAELFGQNSVSRFLGQLYAGQLRFASMLPKCVTYINDSPQTEQVYSVTISTATNGATYTVTSGGSVFSYVATSGTDSVVAAGFAAAWNANRTFASQFFATAASAVVTLTAQEIGVTYTVTTSDSKITLASVNAGATANPVTFGDVVVQLSGQDDNGTPFATVASSDLFTAQVADLTATYAAGETYTIFVTLYGVQYTIGPVPADTNTNTTATAIRAALTAGLSGLPITVSGATSHAILTANLAGIGFTVTVALGSGTISRLTVTDTTAGSRVDFNSSVAGIAVLVQNQPSSSVGVAGQQYVPNSNMTIAPDGVGVGVISEQTVLPSDPVYVELSPGAYAGLCYNTTSSTRVKWVGAKWTPKAANNAAEFNRNIVTPATSV